MPLAHSCGQVQQLHTAGHSDPRSSPCTSRSQWLPRVLVSARRDSCCTRRLQGRVPHAARDVFDNLEQRDGFSSKGSTFTASDEQPFCRPWWEAEASQPSGPAPDALSARISSSEQASTSQPAGSQHGHQPGRPEAPQGDRSPGGNSRPSWRSASSPQAQAATGTLSSEPQASPSTDTAGAELQASSWEPWFDRQQSEGWDDWGSPQRPSEPREEPSEPREEPSEPRWEPPEPRWESPAQGQPNDNAAGSSRGPADQAAAQAASRAAAADTVYTFTPEDVQRGADLPDLTELTDAEKERLLPITPSAEQIKRASGSSLDVLQRLGVAGLVSLVSIKLVLLATGAVLYPLWGPVWTAYSRNQSLRQRGRHVALWRAQVLDYQVLGRPRGWNAGRSPALPNFAGPVLRLLVGDSSGARTELLVPHRPEFNVVAQGEPAELLVLSPGRTFKSFQALKEVYLPEAGVWVADYPYINRDLFLGFSLEVERDRQAAVQQPVQQPV